MRKILVWKDEAGAAQVGYYKGSYFAMQYQIADQKAVIANLDNALATITEATAP